MSSASMAGPGYRLDYYTERRGDPPNEHVTAVVVWRGGEPPRLGLRARWHRALARLRPAPGFDGRLPHPGWDASSDYGGPREVLHSQARRVVRLGGRAGGREVPFPPDGRTLLVLVDDERPSTISGGPSVAVRAAAVEPQRAADADLPGGELHDLEAERLRRQNAAVGAVRRAVRAALRADDAARMFLPPAAWDVLADGFPDDPAAWGVIAGVGAPAEPRRGGA